MSWVVRNAEKGGGNPYQVVLEPETLARKTADSVRVKWTASALNHRDNWITKGMYPGITPGVILGSDGVAILQEACGEIPKGCRVLVDPSIAWKRNSVRAPGPSLGILGMPTDGTFTQGVCHVPRINVRKCPSHLSDLEAAALPLAGVTAYRAVFTKGECKPGDVVVITGIGGGVALQAAQLAVAHGCKVLVTSSSEKKIKTAVEKIGVSGGVNYKEKNWHKKAMGMAGGKVDLVVDGAGGEGVSSLLRMLKPGGIFVSYGATTGPVKQLHLAHCFLNQIEIRGTSMGSPEDFDGLLSFVSKHDIKPIVHETFRFEDLPLALDVMRRGDQFGKLVLVHSSRL